MGYKDQALKGFAWMGSQQVIQRLISYGKIALLARILTPEKFGIFGIAGLILSLLEIFLFTGINTFLLQQKESIKKYVDTAYVMSIIRGFLIAAIVYASAAQVATFFRSPEALTVLRLISIVPLLRGFINPSVATFLKSLNYKKEFVWKIFLFAIESMITIGTALFTRSELSFVYGLIAGVICEVVLSHLLIMPQPRLKMNIIQVKLILKQGRWVTLYNWLEYLVTHGDDGVVGRLMNTTALGVYQNVYKISTLPLTEVVNAVNRVTFSIYVKISDDVYRLKTAFFKTLIFSQIIIIPVAAIFFFFPELIIKIFLGNNWIAGTEALRILAIYGFFVSLITLPNSVFLALKRQDIIAKLKGLQFVIVVLSIFPFVSRWGILGAGFSVLISAMFATPITYWYLFLLLKNNKNR